LYLGKLVVKLRVKVEPKQCLEVIQGAS